MLMMVMIVVVVVVVAVVVLVGARAPSLPLHACSLIASHIGEVTTKDISEAKLATYIVH